MTGKNIFRAQPGESASCDRLGLTFCKNTHISYFVFRSVCDRTAAGDSLTGNTSPSLLFGVPQGRRSSPPSSCRK